MEAAKLYLQYRARACQFSNDIIFSVCLCTVLHIPYQPCGYSYMHHKPHCRLGRSASSGCWTNCSDITLVTTDHLQHSVLVVHAQGNWYSYGQSLCLDTILFDRPQSCLWWSFDRWPNVIISSKLAALVQLMVHLVKLSCFLINSLAALSHPR